MLRHYRALDITTTDPSGPRGTIILGRDDMPAGAVGYGPTGGRDRLSLWPINDTPGNVSTFTISRCREALSRAWPGIGGDPLDHGTYRRDMRAFGLPA